ncbi:MAG: hypothetical protein AAF585_28125, partial [Verrucomicrobiota bacterium]
ARLEKDYVDRLRAALPASADATELIDNIRDHIQTALAEIPAAAEVSLSKMAAILEELGSPESIAAEFAESTPVVSQSPPSAPAQTQDPYAPPASHPSPPTGAKIGLFQTLDRLFIGYLVTVVGLWVPFIGLHFCHIVGFGLMYWALHAGGAHIPKSETAKKLLLAALCIVIALFPLTILSLAAPLIALVAFPLSLGWMALDIVVFWMLMTGLAEVADQRAPEMSARIRDRRIMYLIASIVFLILATAIGLVIAVNSNEERVSELAGFVLLPFWWVVGWFLILKPIRQLRNRVQPAAV